MKQNNLLYLIATVFPIIYLILWLIPNYELFFHLDFQIEDRHILPNNLAMWGYLMKHESWIFVHLVKPFFIYVYATQSIPWSIVILIIHEMFEALCVIMGFSMGPVFGATNTNFFSNWWKESTGDTLWGDIPQGTIGILIAAYLLNRYFPDILVHLRERKKWKNQFIFLIANFIILCAMDAVGLVSIKLPQPLPGIGPTIPIGYMFQILGFMIVFKIYWWFNDHRTLCCIPEERLKLFHSHLIVFLTGGWLSTGILIIPTYLGLWIFIGFFLSYITLVTTPTYLKDGWLIDHCERRIYCVANCKYLTVNKKYVYN